VNACVGKGREFLKYILNVVLFLHTDKTPKYIFWLSARTNYIGQAYLNDVYPVGYRYSYVWERLEKLTFYLLRTEDSGTMCCTVALTNSLSRIYSEKCSSKKTYKSKNRHYWMLHNSFKYPVMSNFSRLCFHLSEIFIEHFLIFEQEFEIPSQTYYVNNAQFDNKYLLWYSVFITY
jgi:hypothetical protein